MNGFIKRQEVTGLEKSLQRVIAETDSQYVKDYLQSVLELPDDDRTKWFLTSDEVADIPDDRDPITTCVVIQTVCAVITTIITVYNAVTKEYEEKEVQKEKCVDKKVTVPCE